MCSWHLFHFSVFFIQNSFLFIEKFTKVILNSFARPNNLREAGSVLVARAWLVDLIVSATTRQI